MSLAPLYEVVTRNDATASDNKIHSDEIAKKYGFRGGLVPGVTVFGHMTYPLVAHFGEAWLARASGEVRFLKPAYDGETLVIRANETAQGAEVICENKGGDVLAKLTTQLEQKPAQPDPLWRSSAGKNNPPREEIKQENIRLDVPFAPMRVKPSMDNNRKTVEMLSDTLPLYRRPPSDILAAPAHPLWFARICNAAFVEHWIMPAWIHVGTVFRFHRVLRIDQSVEVRTIPTRQWENKGHEFATLYIAMLVDGEIAAEAQHTAIYKVAER